jgi:hypothetical protein
MYDRFETGVYGSFGGSSLDGEAESTLPAEDETDPTDPIGAIHGTEPLMTMLALKPNDYVVVHSRFQGPPAMQAPTAAENAAHGAEIFAFEGEADRDRNEIASGPETEWWCVGFRVAEPALEGCFPLRVLKGLAGQPHAT